MNNQYLRYLRTINRHVSGPINHAVSGDRLVAHMPKAINAVLNRLIAEGEAAESSERALLSQAHTWLESLKTIFPPGDDHAKRVAELESQLHQDIPLVEAINNILSDLMPFLAESNEAKSLMLYDEILSHDWYDLQRLESDFYELSKAPPMELDNPDSNGLTREQQATLIGLLKDQCLESDQLAFTKCTVVMGGFSKTTILVDLTGNQVLPDGIVIRFDRPETPLDTTVVAEFPLLELLHHKGVKVPKPWLLDKQGLVAGSPLMVVSRIDGEIIADGHHFYIEPETDNLGLELARELARLHAVPLNELPLSVPGSDHDNKTLMAAELNKFRTLWDECGDDSRTVEAAFHWLENHLEYVGEMRSLVHGDTRFHNILVKGNSIASILDWEVVTHGNPGFDLGYAYEHVTQIMPWADFLAAYEEAGGQIPDENTLKFYVLRTELFIMVYLNKIKAGFLQGAYDNIDLVFAGTNLRQHTHYLLAKRLQTILNNEPL